MEESRKYINLIVQRIERTDFFDNEAAITGPL